MYKNDFDRTKVKKKYSAGQRAWNLKQYAKGSDPRTAKNLYQATRNRRNF